MRFTQGDVRNQPSLVRRESKVMRIKAVADDALRNSLFRQMDSSA
jgi:hypothetical protein